MKLLVSVKDRAEAAEAEAGGSEIIDVKNPSEGSLGANFPWVIREIRTQTPPTIEVSATLGDLPYLPGTASLAALGAAASGVQYVKVGVFGPRNIEEAVHLVRGVRRGVDSAGWKVKVIAAGYGDFQDHGCLNPLKLPEVAAKGEADGVMVDLKVKGRGDLFHHLTLEEIQRLVEAAHRGGFIVGVAGSLGLKHVKPLLRLGVDIMGVRGSVCLGGDRVGGCIEKRRVTELVRAIRG